MRKLSRALGKSVKASHRSVEQFRSTEERLVEENEKLSITLNQIDEEIEGLYELKERGSSLMTENQGIIVRIRDFIRGGN